MNLLQTQAQTFVLAMLLFAAPPSLIRAADKPAGDPTPDVRVSTISSKPLVAFIPSVVKPGDHSADGISASVLAGLIEAELLRTKDMALVERAEIEKAFAELNLSAAEAPGRTEVLALGEMLKADILIIALPVRQQGKQTLLVKVVESATAAIRSLAAYPLDGKAEETARKAVEQIHQAVNDKAAASMPSLAITRFQNRSRFDRLMPLEFGIRDQLEATLSRYPRVRVYERMDMRPLLDEDRLPTAGLEPASGKREAVYFLTGSFKESTETATLMCALEASLFDQGSRKLVWQTHLEFPATNWVALCGVLASNVMHVLQTGGGQPPAEDMAGTEADQLFADTLKLLRQTRLILPNDKIWRLITDGSRPPLVAKFDSMNPLQKEALLHLVRKCINNLDCHLFLQPHDLKAKLLLARCLSPYDFQDAEFYDYKRAVQLLKEVIVEDTNGKLAPYADESIGLVYRNAAAHYRNTAKTEYNTCLRAYIDFKASHGDWYEAAYGYRWELRMPDAAWPLYVKALYSYTNLSDNACRHSFHMQGTLVDLRKLAHSDSDRNRELKEILTPLTQHESPCFRYFVWCTLADILAGQNSWQEAEKAYGEAIRICMSQDGLWFRARNQSTAALAGRMLLDAHQPEAGRLFLETYVPDFKKDPQNLSYAYILAEIYQATGRDLEALRICEVYRHAHPTSDAEELQKKINALRMKLKLYEPTQVVTSTSMVFKAFPTPNPTEGLGQLYPAGQLLVCTSHQQHGAFRFFDLQTEDWVTPAFVRREMSDVAAAVFQNGKLFLGGASGLWEIELKSNTVLQHYTTANGLPFNNVTALAADPQELFVGFSDGKRGAVACRGQGGYFKVFDGEDAPSGPIGSLLLEPECVWVGIKHYRAQVLRLARSAGTWQTVFKGGKKSQELPVDGNISTSQATNHVSQLPARLKVECFLQVKGSGQEVSPMMVPLPPQLATKLPKGLLFYFYTALDDKDFVWFAGSIIDHEHGSGLYSVSKKTGALALYGPEQGMPCVAVHDLKRVGPYIWAATADGLVRITPK